MSRMSHVCIVDGKHIHPAPMLSNFSGILDVKYKFKLMLMKGTICSRQSCKAQGICTVHTAGHVSFLCYAYIGGWIGCLGALDQVCRTSGSGIQSILCGVQV